MKKIRKKTAEVRFEKELKQYKKRGIMLRREGREEEISQIVRHCILREETPYMRDYISDEQGKVVEIDFLKVEEK